MSLNSRGVVYIAMGQKYIQEAYYSVESLKVNTDIAVTIFTNRNIHNELFDNVIFIEKTNLSFIDKPFYMYRSPYENTLFLDTDTYIMSDISELFLLLENFDIVAAHEPNRFGAKITEIPKSFIELNTGVILFNKSPKMKDFFQDWLALYQQNLTWMNDQPAFRLALYKSKLRLATLPPEYNCRFNSPVRINGRVHILHGRHPNLPAVAQEINSHMGERVFISGLGLLPPFRGLRTSGGMIFKILILICNKLMAKMIDVLKGNYNNTPMK